MYGGFIAIVLEWAGLAISVIIAGINWGEPMSQYGYYTSTKFVFGIVFTLASISYYLFSRTLDKYWPRTSLLNLLAGILMIVMAWIPYRPYVRGFTIDTHNVAILIAVILYTLPMLFIGYKKVHHSIARYSRIGFFVVITLVSITSIARAAGFKVFILQILTASCFQAWIITVNYLVIKDMRHVQSTLL